MKNYQEIMKNYQAIDPMALILSEKAYLIWYEIHHPRLPLDSDIKKLIESMTPAEKELTYTNAKSLIKYGKYLAEYGKNIEKALSMSKTEVINII